MKNDYGLKNSQTMIFKDNDKLVTDFIEDCMYVQQEISIGTPPDLEDPNVDFKKYMKDNSLYVLIYQIDFKKIIKDIILPYLSQYTSLDKFIKLQEDLINKSTITHMYNTFHSEDEDCNEPEIYIRLADAIKILYKHYNILIYPKYLYDFIIMNTLMINNAYTNSTFGRIPDDSTSRISATVVMDMIDHYIYKDNITKEDYSKIKDYLDKNKTALPFSDRMPKEDPDASFITINQLNELFDILKFNFHYSVRDNIELDTNGTKHKSFWDTKTSDKSEENIKYEADGVVISDGTILMSMNKGYLEDEKSNIISKVKDKIKADKNFPDDPVEYINMHGFYDDNTRKMIISLKDIKEMLYHYYGYKYDENDDAASNNESINTLIKVINESLYHSNMFEFKRRIFEGSVMNIDKLIDQIRNKNDNIK